MNVEVIAEGLENNPQCFHACHDDSKRLDVSNGSDTRCENRKTMRPCLLFRQKNNKSKEYYACSACRDRKECPFYLETGDKRLDKLKNFSKWTTLRRETVEQILTKKPYKKYLKMLKSLKTCSQNPSEEIKESETTNVINKSRNMPTSVFYCYTCEGLFDGSESGNHTECDVKNVTEHQLKHPTEVLVPKEDSKTHAQYFFTKKTVENIVLLLSRLKIKRVLCIGVPRIHEHLVNECKNQFKSMLLDIDLKYFNFYNDKQFIWYNMFNNCILRDDSVKYLEEFLKSKKVIVLMDPPFGGRVEPLACTVNSLTKLYCQVNKLEHDKYVNYMECCDIKKKTDKPLKMESEGSDSDMEYSDDDCSYDVYYNMGGDDCDLEQVDPKKVDPELVDYDCLTVEGVEKLLNESVEKLSNSAQITPSMAKVLLHTHKWAINDIIEQYHGDSNQLLVNSGIKPSKPPVTCKIMCPVCVAVQDSEEFCSLACGHQFCRECWGQHFEVQIRQGISTGIGCMARDCTLLVPEDFVLNLLNRPATRNKYQEFAFRDYVNAHPELRFCPGPNCPIIVRAVDQNAKRIICSECKTMFCFRCGMDYHSPTDCSTIKKWLTKCADDSETANYISAHTKDCPKCHICIEKNGGCNHMQCYNCKHDFCWMCLGNWKTHGAEYYECSRYKENPNIARESVHAQAREALKKYLHYYERWENHSKSMKLEEQTLDKIRERINTKVMSASGTWIDWQYLLSAAALLAKCRYTLQYTYPYAYYMEPGARKELFEYQQAHLEAEIENLSWKIEHAETTDRGDLENQMDIAEKRRTTLLKDFLDV